MWRSNGANEQDTVVNEKVVRTTFSHPTPELPVVDVERAQQHYRDVLGFEIRWLHPGKEIGAVAHDDVAIFFRRRRQPFDPAVHWVFVKLPCTSVAKMEIDSWDLPFSASSVSPPPSPLLSAPRAASRT